MLVGGRSYQDGVDGLADRDLAFNGVQKADELLWLQLRNCKLMQSNSRRSHCLVKPLIKAEGLTHLALLISPEASFGLISKAKCA